MKKLWLETKALFCALIDSIEKEYKSFFKGGVVLVGVSLVGLSQTFPTLIEHDYKAKEIQFEIEAQESKKIADIDCSTLSKNTEKCTLAKYQLNTNQVSVRVASFVVAASMYCGLFLMFLSVLGFVTSVTNKVRKNA